MIREIKDETALPFDRNHHSRQRYDWVRHKIDPTVLIDCMTGECYQRRDGANWEHPAYNVERNIAKDIPWSDIKPNTAPEDLTTYPPATKRSAA